MFARSRKTVLGLAVVVIGVGCTDRRRGGGGDAANDLDAAPDAAGLEIPASCDAPPDGPTRADVMTLATAGPGGALALGATCDPAGNSCAPGTLCCQACCLAETPFVCSAPDPAGSCPLPDVFIDEAYLASSIVQGVETATDSCLIDERCIGGIGSRTLLHFGIRIPNVGTGDMHLGSPSALNPNFAFSACHGHYHFEAYGQYRLLSTGGCVVANGHKSGWCVMDLGAYSASPPGPARYGCGDMGISVGWADTYGVGTGCQWVDVTDVPPGDYVLEATVNPDLLIPESDYTNNTVRVPVTIRASPPPPDGGDVPWSGAITDPCPATTAGVNRECGWDAEGTHPCVAGAAVTVGCNASCAPPAGSCTGDAVLRVCAGPTGSCSYATALGSSDDACGTTCPMATATCPATGSINVLTGAFYSGEAYTCSVVVR